MADGNGDNDEVEKVEEALHQLERLLDHEMRATEEIDSKLRLFLGLTTAIIGASIPFFGSLFPHRPTTWTLAQIMAIALLGIGFVLVVIATSLLIDGYIGINEDRRPDWHIGPAADNVSDIAQDEDISDLRFKKSLAAAYPGFIEDVGEERRRIIEIRHHAVYLMVFGVAFYGAAAFILWL